VRCFWGLEGSELGAGYGNVSVHQLSGPGLLTATLAQEIDGGMLCRKPLDAAKRSSRYH